MTTPYGDAVVDAPWGVCVDVLLLGGGLATFYLDEVKVRD